MNQVLCAAALIKQYRERAKACGIVLSGETYKQVLDECEWTSYEQAVVILARNSHLNSLAQKKRK